MTDPEAEGPLTPDAASSSLRRTAEEIARLQVNARPNMARELAQLDVGKLKGLDLDSATIKAIRSKLNEPRPPAIVPRGIPTAEQLARELAAAQSERQHQELLIALGDASDAASSRSWRRDLTLIVVSAVLGALAAYVLPLILG